MKFKIYKKEIEFILHYLMERENISKMCFFEKRITVKIVS